MSVTIILWALAIIGLGFSLTYWYVTLRARRRRNEVERLITERLIAAGRRHDRERYRRPEPTPTVDRLTNRHTASFARDKKARRDDSSTYGTYTETPYSFTVGDSDDRFGGGSSGGGASASWDSDSSSSSSDSGSSDSGSGSSDSGD